MKEFKRKIAEQLVSGYLRWKKKRKVSEVADNDEHDDMEGISEVLSTHTLLENVDVKSSQCHLCNIMTQGRKEKTSIYSYINAARVFTWIALLFMIHEMLWKNIDHYYDK